MATEIERRFLVSAEALETLHLDQQKGFTIHQGYITSSADQNTCRVRITDDKATLTLKGKPHGPTRSEFEIPIPLDQAREILQTLTVGTPIEKTRYKISHCGLIWEVDCFHGLNAGLIIAEVELEHNTQMIVLPTWVDREITSVARYSNASLAHNPYTRWAEDEKLAMHAKKPSA